MNDRELRVWANARKLTRHKETPLAVLRLLDERDGLAVQCVTVSHLLEVQLNRTAGVADIVSVREALEVVNKDQSISVAKARRECVEAARDLLGSHRDHSPECGCETCTVWDALAELDKAEKGET